MCHVTSTSAKPPAKLPPNHPMAKYVRFQELGSQRFLVLRFDGQNQTQAIVGWLKMDFTLSLIEDYKFVRLHALTAYITLITYASHTCKK